VPGTDCPALLTIRALFGQAGLTQTDPGIRSTTISYGIKGDPKDETSVRGRWRKSLQPDGFLCGFRQRLQTNNNPLP